VRHLHKRLAKLHLAKGASFSKCMGDKCSKAPEVESVWADGRGRAWHCQKCHDKWIQDNKDAEGEDGWMPLDILKEKAVPNGVVTGKYGEYPKVAKAEGKKQWGGTDIGLFIPLPKNLANKFPSLAPKDTSPSHVTFLYIGDIKTEEEQKKLLQVLKDVHGKWWPEVTATLDGLDHFEHKDKDRRVAHVKVDFDKDLSGMRHRVKQALQDAGIPVSDSFPEYKPHVTLKYMDGSDSPDYDGEVPEGSWKFKGMEVWGLPEVHKIKFGPSIHKVSEQWLAKQASNPQLGPRQPLIDKIKYRVKSSYQGVLVAVYAGRKRIGAMVSHWGSQRRQDACQKDIEKLKDSQPKLADAKVLAVYKAFLTDESYRGQGVGKAMYEATMVRGFKEEGPFMFVPMKCSIGSGTSDDAVRVWISLGRRYPSSGKVIGVVRRPTLPAEIKMSTLSARVASRWLHNKVAWSLHGSTHAKSVALMKWLSEATRKLGVAREAYVVGGAVRNFLIDRPIKDIDIVFDSIAAKHDSDWLAAKLARMIPVPTNVTTNQYGVAILTVKGPWDLDGEDMKGEVIEIANARKESYGGAGGKGYKPSEVEPATIEEDLLRREFTFNTLLWRLDDLASGPEKAEILDLTGCGRKDLEDGILSCPSNPDKTFSDDPTRILRAIKFTGKYGFKIPPDLAKSIKRNAPKMKRMPWEAIGTILVENILKEPTARKSLKQMKDLGILDVISEMIKSTPPFKTYMAGQFKKNRQVGLLLDMMDLGLPVGTALQGLKLNPKQMQRFREITIGMDEKDAGQYLDVLLKPPVDNRKVFEALDLQGPDRSKIKPAAQQLLLQDPSLASNARKLTDEVIRALR